MTTMPTRSVNDASQRATPSRFSRDSAWHISTARGRGAARRASDIPAPPVIDDAPARPMTCAGDVGAIALAGERRVDVDRLLAAERDPLHQLQRAAERPQQPAREPVELEVRPVRLEAVGELATRRRRRLDQVDERRRGGEVLRRRSGSRAPAVPTSQTLSGVLLAADGDEVRAQLAAEPAGRMEGGVVDERTRPDDLDVEAALGRELRDEQLRLRLAPDVGPAPQVPGVERRRLVEDAADLVPRLDDREAADVDALRARRRRPPPRRRAASRRSSCAGDRPGRRPSRRRQWTTKPTPAMTAGVERPRQIGDDVLDAWHAHADSAAAAAPARGRANPAWRSSADDAGCRAGRCRR